MDTSVKPPTATDLGVSMIWEISRVMGTGVGVRDGLGVGVRVGRGVGSAVGRADGSAVGRAAGSAVDRGGGVTTIVGTACSRSTRSCSSLASTVDSISGVGPTCTGAGREQPRATSRCRLALIESVVPSYISPRLDEHWTPKRSPVQVR